MSDRMNQAKHASLGALFIFAALGVAGLGVSACRGKTDPGSSANADSNSDTAPTSERIEIDLFAFGRQLGTVAPCGCTADPLGGLQYAFGYIEDESQAGRRLIVEPGSFLFPDPDGPEGPVGEAAWAQAKERARLLHTRFSQLDGLVSGLGPTDVAAPEAGLAALEQFPLPRVLANIDADAAPIAGVERVRVIQLGHGLEATVTSVVDPSMVEGARTRWAEAFPAITDPLPALQRLAPQMAEADLQVVVVNGPRSLAEDIARELEGVDVVVVGGEFHNPDRARLGTAPTFVGGAWILEPGDRAQSLAHLTLSLAATVPEGSLPAEWTVIPPQSQREAELVRVVEKLAKFAGDPTADARFIGRLEDERDQLAAALENPEIDPAIAVAVIPAQTKVSCRLPEDAAAQTALRDYDGWVAEKNRGLFAGVHAPAPAEGEAGYAGIDACADCHEEAVATWNKSVHARAYETLVTANKQFDLSCVNCHVTGFRLPGGSEVVENEGLQSVQCEQCHGPGSLHVEDPSTDNIRLEAPASVCLSCHTPEHSDTFDYEPYLRDILDTGHGATARAALGEGETAAILRAAAVEAAGGGCKKM